MRQLAKLLLCLGSALPILACQSTNIERNNSTSTFNQSAEQLPVQDTTVEAQRVSWMKGSLPDIQKTSTREIKAPLIRPNDTVHIDIYEVPKLGGEFEVGSNGKIKVPLLGPVEAAGFTSQELSGHLEAALGLNYLQNPQVNVKLEPAEHTVDKVSIDGAVKKPGIYDVPEGTTLMKAIAQSGGVNEFADLSKVIIFREIDNERVAARYNVARIRKGKEPDPIIFGNDIILIEDSGIKRSRREIVQSLPLFLLFGGL